MVARYWHAADPLVAKGLSRGQIRRPGSETRRRGWPTGALVITKKAILDNSVESAQRGGSNNTNAVLHRVAMAMVNALQHQMMQKAGQIDRQERITNIFGGSRNNVILRLRAPLDRAKAEEPRLVAGALFDLSMHVLRRNACIIAHGSAEGCKPVHMYGIPQTRTT